MKKIVLTIISLAFVVSLTACTTVTEGSTTKTTTETLPSGGTVECVTVGATSGGVSIYCIDATYVPPAK